MENKGGRLRDKIVCIISYLILKCQKEPLKGEVELLGKIC